MVHAEFFHHHRSFGANIGSRTAAESFATPSTDMHHVSVQDDLDFDAP
jgi:hypothetical protein